MTTHPAQVLLHPRRKRSAIRRDTNPLATKKNAERSLKLQKPVLEPLMHVVSAASPVFHALGWLAYRSGLAHIQLTLKVPTLIISGDQDVTTLPVASDRMQRDIPGAVRASVSPAAHMGPVEQSTRYAQLISTFAASR